MACTPNTVVKWEDVATLAAAADALITAKGLTGVATLLSANSLFGRTTFESRNIDYTWTLADGEAGCMELSNFSGFSGHTLDDVENAASAAGRLRFVGAVPGTGANANGPCFCCIVAKVTDLLFSAAPEDGSCVQRPDFDAPCLSGAGASRTGLLNTVWIDNASTIPGPRDTEKETGGVYIKQRRACAGGAMDGVSYEYIWDSGAGVYQLRNIKLKLKGYFGWQITATDFQQIYDKLSEIVGKCLSNGDEVLASGSTSYVAKYSTLTLADVLWTIHENEGSGPSHDPGCLVYTGERPWVEDTCGGSSGSCGQKLYCNTLLHIQQVIDFVSGLTCQNPGCETFGCRGKVGRLGATASLYSYSSQTGTPRLLSDTASGSVTRTRKYTDFNYCGCGNHVVDHNKILINAGYSFVYPGPATNSGKFANCSYFERDVYCAIIPDAGYDPVCLAGYPVAQSEIELQLGYLVASADCTYSISESVDGATRTVTETWTGVGARDIVYPYPGGSDPCDPPHNYPNDIEIEHNTVGSVTRVQVYGVKEAPDDPPVPCAKTGAVSGTPPASSIGESTVVTHVIRITGNDGTTFAGNAHYKTRSLPSGAWAPASAVPISGTPSSGFVDVSVDVPEAASGSEVCLDYIELNPLTYGQLRTHLSGAPECPRFSPSDPECEGAISDPPEPCDVCPYSESTSEGACVQEDTQCCAWISEVTSDSGEDREAPGWSPSGTTEIAGHTAWQGVTLSNLVPGTSYELTLTFLKAPSYDDGCAFEAGTPVVLTVTFEADAYYEVVCADSSDCIVEEEVAALQEAADLWNSENPLAPAREVSTTETDITEFPFDFAGTGASKLVSCAISPA